MFVGISLQVEEPGINLAKHSVPVTRNHLSFFESFIYKFLDQLGTRRASLMVLFESNEPLEAFLVRKAVERSREAVESG